MVRLKKSKWNDLFFDMIEKFPELCENYPKEDLINHYSWNGEMMSHCIFWHVFDVIEYNFQKGNKDFLKKIFAYIEELLTKDEDCVGPIGLEILACFYKNERCKGIESYFGEETMKAFKDICKYYEEIRKGIAALEST